MWKSHFGSGWGVPCLGFSSYFCAHQHRACGCHSRVSVTRVTKVFSRIDEIVIAFGKHTVQRVYTLSFFYSYRGFSDIDTSNRHFDRTSPSTLNVLFIVMEACHGVCVEVRGQLCNWFLFFLNSGDQIHVTRPVGLVPSCQPFMDLILFYFIF